MNPTFPFHFTSLSSLDMSWPSMLFTSSILPRNFSASSSSLMYVEKVIFSQLAQKSLTFSPSEDGPFPQASAQSDLDPSLLEFWHFLTLTPSLPPQVLTANCLINVSYYNRHFSCGNWACLDGRYCQHLPLQCNTFSLTGQQLII